MTFPQDLNHWQVLAAIRKKYNLGDLFYVDLWPLYYPLLVVSDGQAMTTFAKTDHPKPQWVKDMFAPVLGKWSFAFARDAEWRIPRTLFAQAFSANYLATILPAMVQSMQVFTERIRQLAETGETFIGFELASAVSFEIIGRVLLARNFDCQRRFDPLQYHLRHLIQARSESLNPVRQLISSFLRRYHAWNVDRLVAAEILRRGKETNAFTRQLQQSAAIDWLLRPSNGIPESLISKHKNGTLSKNSQKVAVSHIKSLLVAGHETTASTFLYTLILLTTNPIWMTRVCHEHDEVFGTNPDTVAVSLIDDFKLVNQLPLTTACIKESLRLYPQGVMPRQASTGEYFEYNGKRIPLWYGAVTFNHGDLFRHEGHWRNSDEFDPSRFLDNGAPISPEIYRPFERGLRSCIGQELAMLELKMLLVFVLRQFEFELAYPPGSPQASKELGGYYYQTVDMGAVPAAGMPMKVRLRQRKA